ncbi:MAG: SDR family NAD(P)-dependent oxidoreductase [Bacteroidales bacterium]|nr:SDR family NAD(P)-dependent oxidoreductase [Bacteroidales bacterium]
MNILITGTSKGLGYGLSRYYLEAGHRVYGISRSSNDELDGFDNFSFLQQDLTEFKNVGTKLPQFLSGVNKLDLVILNAGVLNEIKDLRDTGMDEIKAAMDINVWANKVLIDTLFDSVKTLHKIVAISSGASVNGSRGWNVYSLSKAALNMMMDLYSKEHTDSHFIALAPGLIDTAMQEYISGLEDEDKYPVIKKLKQARGTEQMPEPIKAAGIVAAAIERSDSQASGSFLDVREM